MKFRLEYSILTVRTRAWSLDDYGSGGNENEKKIIGAQKYGVEERMELLPLPQKKKVHLAIYSML